MAEGVTSPSTGWSWLIVIGLILTGVIIINYQDKREKEGRILSGTYLVPPGKTISKTIEGHTLTYNWYADDRKDRVTVRVAEGNWNDYYKKIVWINPNSKNWVITRETTRVSATPPRGEAIISFKNLNPKGSDAYVQIRVKIKPSQ